MDKTKMNKKESQLQNWPDTELARQESRMTVTQWYLSVYVRYADRC